jgi:tetratricopeptide (TPR) repeat protein
MAMASVEATAIGADGTIGKWQEGSPMTTPRFLPSSVRLEDTVYVVGGQNTIALSGTERADLLADGTIGPWVSDTPLNIPRRAAGAVGVGNAIYILGGMNGPIGQAAPVNAVEVAYRVSGRALGREVEAGDPDEASYKEWKSAAPLDAQTYMSQALDRLSSGDFRVVLFDTGEAIRIDPGNYQAYNIRADALYRIGDTSGSINALKASLEIKENNFDALMGMGNIQFNQSNFPEAVRYFGKAAEAMPDSQPAHEQLGKAYLQTGNREAAEKEFERLLDRTPDSPSIQKLLELSRQGPEKTSGN